MGTASLSRLVLDSSSAAEARADDPVDHDARRAACIRIRARRAASSCSTTLGLIIRAPHSLRLDLLVVVRSVAMTCFVMTGVGSVRVSGHRGWSLFVLVFACADDEASLNEAEKARVGPRRWSGMTLGAMLPSAALSVTPRS
jgi:hypothetical protein